MEFVVVVIISAVLYFIYVKRSASDLITTKKVVGGEQIEQHWHNILVNKEAEQEVDEYVKDPKNKQEILDALSENLSRALGEDYAKKLDLGGKYMLNDAYTKDIAFGFWTKELLLAKKGFVSEKSYRRGINADGGGGDKMMMRINLVHECERELRKKYPELRYYYMRVTSWNPLTFRFQFQYYQYKKPELFSYWKD